MNLKCDFQRPPVAGWGWGAVGSQLSRGEPLSLGEGGGHGRGLSIWESALWPAGCWQVFWTDWPSVHLPSASLREAISYPRWCSALAAPCTHWRLQGNQERSGHTWATQVRTTGDRTWGSGGFSSARRLPGEPGVVPLPEGSAVPRAKCVRKTQCECFVLTGTPALKPHLCCLHHSDAGPAVVSVLPSGLSLLPVGPSIPQILTLSLFGG